MEIGSGPRYGKRSSASYNTGGAKAISDPPKTYNIMGVNDKFNGKNPFAPRHHDIAELGIPTVSEYIHENEQREISEMCNNPNASSHKKKDKLIPKKSKFNSPRGSPTSSRSNNSAANKKYVPIA